MKKHGSLESVLGRIDNLDSLSLTILVKRLARERDLLETVFQTIREGVLVIERSGLIHYANPAASRLLGLHSQELGRTNLWKSVPDLFRSLPIGKKGLEGEAVMTRELELNYPEHRTIRLSLVPLEEPDLAESGPSRLLAAILSDITADKVRSQEELESEKVNSVLHLAAGVAHELGNPLNSIAIHLQLLQRQVDKIKDKATARKLNDSVTVCSREIERLNGIVHNFLEAVRPQAPELVDADLLNVMENALELLRPELSDAAIAVEVQTPSTIPAVLADPRQIQQVLFNILKNAREAMQAGGAIKIKVFSDDEFVFIQVADTGVGIPEENLSRIFLPYFTTKDTGTGLGMLIAQRIIRAHGGNIGVDSRLHAGTIVTLQFPQKHRRIRMLK